MVRPHLAAIAAAVNAATPGSFAEVELPLPPKKPFTREPSLKRRMAKTGRAMWQMIGVLAELERSLIVERTQAGMKEARRRGVQFGRKKKLTPAQIAKARKLIEGGERVEDVAAIWNVGRTTLYRALSS